MTTDLAALPPLDREDLAGLVLADLADHLTADDVRAVLEANGHIPDDSTVAVVLHDVMKVLTDDD